MGKVVVITGASGGLAREIIKLHEGDTVCSLSLDNPYQDSNFYYCDVTDEDNVKDCFAQIFAKFKHIDIIYVNAGVGMAGALELTDSQKFRTVCDVNFYGAYHTLKHGCGYLKKGARIVSMCSVSGLFALPFRSAYCASKAALHLMTLSLAMELKPKGVYAVSVCPGEIRTAFVNNRVIDTDDQAYGGRVQKMLQEIDKKQHTRMSVQYAARKIYAIATAKRPKRFYIIGFKYKLFYFLSKVLPTNLFLKLTELYM